ncbi:MAG: hypothetical protein ATN33_03695 [Epulopiscium sp. Nele67-Bin001]|nr:MAG: hypothetical protein ATN33_03695 [Epulopiscium sp. Nele67-Bin001]
MKIKDLIVMSLRSLWRRKLRTFLTVFGVVIGSISIILMLSVGIAMEQNFRTQIESMGQLTMIEVGKKFNDTTSVLNDEIIEQLEAIPGVNAVIPRREIYVYLQSGKYRTFWTTQLVGMSQQEMELLGYTNMAEGSSLKDGEKNSIVLGGGILREFVRVGKDYDWENATDLDIDIGEKMEILIGSYDWETKNLMDENYVDGTHFNFSDGYEVSLAGITPTTDYNTMYSAFIPIDLWKQLYDTQNQYLRNLYGDEQYDEYYATNEGTYNRIYVKVADENDVTSIQQTIIDMGLSAYSSMDYLNEMQTMSRVIQMFLGGIGAIALFVAAIGITNTMMMATYERTREIGIMKVIGARITDIQKMFLIEALMIGALGGFAGVVISYLISWGLNIIGGPIMAGMMGTASGKISVIPIWLASASFLFSTFIGLISGYFPAKRAMKLSALSAMRE